MRPRTRPRTEVSRFATTDAGWLKLVSRALALLIVVVLIVLLFMAGRSVLAEGERLALGLAEKHLENLVWLEGKRALAEGGVDGLRSRAGSDPRTWAQDRLLAVRPSDAPAGPMPEWAGGRWTFDAIRGELVYRALWLPEGDHRWRVHLLVDGVDSPTPGLARDLLLERVAPAAAKP